MHYDNYVRTRADYGKVASFALYNDTFAADSKSTDLGEVLRVDSEDEFMQRGLDRALAPQSNNGSQVVLYALNFSNANHGKGTTDDDFAAFHMTYNDSKLAALVDRAPILRGAYITDLFKNYAQSSAREVMNMFRAEQIQFDPKGIIKELTTLGIDANTATHIVLGHDAEEVWRSDPISTSIYLTHYSAQGMGMDAYVERALGNLAQAGLS